MLAALPSLPPLVVVVPLIIAGLLLATSHVLPKRVPDVIAILTAFAVMTLCMVMERSAEISSIVYWFGGWVPRHGFPLGIGFVVDPINAGLGGFIALLFGSTLVFAWGYYDEVHAHFHVLMMLFMAAMIGFCLTHDLFNMFVWFEVLSVAGFALTGYQLRSSALEGALNFTITNGIASYLFLTGIGLAYCRLGALDFSALQQGVGAAPSDAVVYAAFALLVTALLIKAAQVPFHFWLSDAHAVAPSPVSVIFSGAMVALGVVGLVKLCWGVFEPSAAIRQLIRTLFLNMGGASILIGAVMATRQRHIKRLLAFSTISHMGVLVVGLSFLEPNALAGLVLYLVGHGLVKGALFMVAGCLLALCGGIDEIDLRGRGAKLWPAGVLMLLAALLLAGVPFGLMGRGMEYLGSAIRSTNQEWLLAVLVIGDALTGGAVLRVVGRVFLGWGKNPGAEATAPTEEEQEKADRPLWIMLLPAILLVAVALCSVPVAQHIVQIGVGRVVHPDNQLFLGLAGRTEPPAVGLYPTPSKIPWISLLLAIAFALASLRLSPNPSRRSWVYRAYALAGQPLQKLHSGIIGDYVAWITLGLAAFSVVFWLNAQVFHYH
jgi:multicomponent Na+:H+ antiporter subunit D